MKGLFVTLCVALLLFASCQDLGTANAESFLGHYSYKAYDTLGIQIAVGTLSLFKNNAKVSGHWTFTDGRSGELEGTASNGNLSLNLNPKHVDDNLLLLGTLAGDMFAGTWQQIGFPGVMARGTFRAFRIR
jgi:hypothetical protein